MLEAVGAFATRAADKLCKQDDRASQIQVCAHTSPHREGSRFSRSILVPLVRPTADTRLLVEAAAAGMRTIYFPGFNLIKAGVILMDMVGPNVHQDELTFDDPPARDLDPLMSALDGLNARYGKGTVHVASTGQTRANQDWSMRQGRRTPRYTTEWSELPIARA